MKAITQPLYGFGGKEAVHTLGVVAATLKVDEVEATDIEILVVNDQVQPHAMIIGRTFTELDYIAYAKVGNTLTFGYADKDPFKDLDIGVLRPKNRIYCAETTELQPKTVCFINVEHSGGNGQVQVSNTSDKLVRVKRGQIMAKVPEVNEVHEISKPCDDITRAMIDVDPEATEEQVAELVAILRQYRKCFALNLDELGCTPLVTADIQDTGIPVRAKPYIHNARDREQISGIIREGKRCGIVSETLSPYASPVLLVGKRDGDKRLVIDYRALNSQTVQINYPIHTMDEQFEKLSGARLFTILDLSNGYLQLPLTEEAKPKTAFITQDETGQFERLSFGLKNAPFQFVHLMNIVLGRLRNNVAMCYLDDLLIPARDWSDMLDKLKMVLEALMNAGLTLKITKCQFGRKRVEYLGQIIEDGFVRPSERKTAAIKEFPDPRNVHEVRQFLGLSGYFRRYVHKYAERARALSNLLKASSEFKWGQEEIDAFNDLKNALTCEPVLQLFNENAETELHTDASGKGLAAMLLQKGEDNKLHLVYCISKKTTSVEAQYHSSKLELFAIVWAVERLRLFLLGRHFTIVTDCEALVRINEKKTGAAQIARWMTLLSEYEYDIKHREGKNMSHVDALSRSPLEPAEDTEEFLMNRMTVMIISEEEFIETIQGSDDKLKRKMDILKKDDRTEEEETVVKGYVLERGRLYRKVKVRGEERLLYVIPDGVRKSVVVKFHDLMGHFALERTVANILQCYWFRGLRRYVKQHIRGCVECLYNKIPGGKQAGFLNPIVPPNRPFGRVHCDLIGPFVRTQSGNCYVAVFICALTKYTRLYGLQNSGANEVLRAFEQYVLEYGLPDRLVTDRGTCFTATEFHEFVEKNGVRHTVNSSRHPRANGQVERVNRTLVPVVIATMQGDTNWDESLYEVQRDLNSAVNETTGKTPFESLYGFRPIFYDGILRRVADKDAEWTPPAIIQDELKETIKAAQEKTKRRFDTGRYRGMTFRVGDVVVMKRNPEATGESTKLQQKYRGPLVISKVLPSDTYGVTNLNPNRGGKVLHTTAHVSQLKRYINADEDLDIFDEEDDEFLDEIFKDNDKNAPAESMENVTEFEEIQGPVEEPAGQGRSGRQRKTPKWMDDFVCDTGEDTD